MNNTISINKDLKFGLLQEDLIKPQLEKFFEVKLIKNKNPYSIIDFTNKERNIYIELKSRRMNHDRFKTIVVGYNKIKHLNFLNVARKYLVWNCQDGLYYLEYTKELMELKPRSFFRNDRIGSSLVVDISATTLKKIPT